MHSIFLNFGMLFIGKLVVVVVVAAGSPESIRESAKFNISHKSRPAARRNEETRRNSEYLS